MIGTEAFRFRFRAMGSPCELQCYADNETRAGDTFELVNREVERLEKKYSRYRVDSVLNVINQSAAKQQWVNIDQETDALLNYADQIFFQSGGLFDVSSGVLRQLWDFKQSILPDPSALEVCLSKVGWSKIEREPLKLRFTHAGMEIDLGGLVKEYAVDACLAKLLDNGITSALIDLGGDIGVTGPRPDGSPWQVGIAHPRIPGKAFAQIPIEKGCVATSGDYERFFELDDRRYCHLLNPISGYPSDHCQAVSVIAERCIIAGSVSTSAMLLGDRAGLEWLKQMELPFLLISREGVPHLGDPKTDYLRIDP